MDESKPTEVVVREVDIGFWSMVVLLLQLAFAAIPAGIILFITFALLSGILSLFTGR